MDTCGLDSNGPGGSIGATGIVQTGVIAADDDTNSKGTTDIEYEQAPEEPLGRFGHVLERRLHLSGSYNQEFRCKVEGKYSVDGDI